MSLPVPKAEPQEDEVSLLAPNAQDLSQDGIHVIPAAQKLEGNQKSRNDGDGFLSAPVSEFLRPLSPDTLSHLSADEFEQIYSSRAAVQVQPASHEAPRGSRGRLHAFWVRNKGLAYMMLSQFFGTLMNVTTRLLEVEGNKGKGLHPFQILFARMGITLVLSSGYMWYKKTPYFPFGMPEVRWLLVARGFGGFFGVFGMYYSLLYLPLSDATVITFLAPGLACWACSILINEPFTKWDKIGTFVSLAGVVFIARPSTFFEAFAAVHAPPAGGTSDMVPGGNTADTARDQGDSRAEDVTPAQRLFAVGIALVGVLGAVAAFTTIRWIGKRAHPLISVNYLATWCTFVSIVMQFALPGVGFLLPADLKDWGYLILLGTSGFIMQYLLAAALSYEKSSRATNMTYTQMLFALGADKLIFDHTPDVLSIIGSSLILGSAIVVALQKDSSPKKETPDDARIAADEEMQLGLLATESEVDGRESGDSTSAPGVQLRSSA